MEEFEPQKEQQSSNIQTQEEIKTSEVSQSNLESLPRLEDLLKSEKQVKVNKEIKGLQQVKTSFNSKEQEFTQKKDEKKVNAKRRLKTITGVYVAVASLLAIFAGVNVITLAILNKQVTTNLDTIQTKQQQVESIATEGLPSAEGDINLILGSPPRDYDDDKQELTFLDRITILFRSLFG